MSDPARRATEASNTLKPGRMDERTSGTSTRLCPALARVIREHAPGASICSA